MHIERNKLELSLKKYIIYTKFMKNDVYSEDINIVERFYWNMDQSAVL